MKDRVLQAFPLGCRAASSPRPHLERPCTATPGPERTTRNPRLANLAPALRYAREHGPNPEVARRLPSEAETTLYRVVQEALTNIAKHAGARHVSVLVARRGSSATAVVEDDGHGFDWSDEARGGIGLAGMRERVALLDGRLTVESGRGTGTTLVADVPLA